MSDVFLLYLDGLTIAFAFEVHVKNVLILYTIYKHESKVVQNMTVRNLMRILSE